MHNYTWLPRVSLHLASKCSIILGFHVQHYTWLPRASLYLHGFHVHHYTWLTRASLYLASTCIIIPGFHVHHYTWLPRASLYLASTCIIIPGFHVHHYTWLPRPALYLDWIILLKLRRIHVVDKHQFRYLREIMSLLVPGQNTLYINWGRFSSNPWTVLKLFYKFDIHFFQCMLLRWTISPMTRKWTRTLD